MSVHCVFAHSSRKNSSLILSDLCEEKTKENHYLLESQKNFVPLHYKTIDR